jgi:type III pantothenate kinase
VILAVDIGNTNTVLGLLDGRDVRHHWRISTDSGRTADEIATQVDQLLRIDSISPALVEASVMCSVVPNLTEPWRKTLRRFLEADPLIVTSQVPLPIKIDVDIPEQVGTDRIANAVGANVRVGGPALVLDCGTATNIDVIDANGNYVGGVILPGPEISAEALATKAAALPRITMERPERVIGRNTIACMQSGLFHGFMGAIERLIDGVRGELGAPDCPVLTTGGLGAVIARESNRIHSHEAWLTLEGLAAILEHGQKNAG